MTLETTDLIKDPERQYRLLTLSKTLKASLSSFSASSDRSLLAIIMRNSLNSIDPLPKWDRMVMKLEKDNMSTGITLVGFMHKAFNLQCFCPHFPLVSYDSLAATIGQAPFVEVHVYVSFNHRSKVHALCLYLYSNKMLRCWLILNIPICYIGHNHNHSLGNSIF